MAATNLEPTGANIIGTSAVESGQSVPEAIHKEQRATHERGTAVLPGDLSEGAGGPYRDSVRRVRQQFLQADLPLGDGGAELPTRKMQRLAIVVDGQEVWAPHPNGGGQIVTFRPDSERAS